MARPLIVVLAALALLLPWQGDATPPVVSAEEPEHVYPQLDSDGDGIADQLEALLAEVTGSGRIDVVVTFAGPNARAQARSAAKKLKAEHEFGIVAGFAATLTLDEVLALAQKPGLFRIEEDRVYRVTLDAANRDFGTAAARQTFGVDGSGVGICIVDTGVDASHEQLDDPGKVVGWADFVNGVPNPYDDQGHGTHVASIAAGSGTGGASASTFQGVAPGAAVYATKVLDSTGQGTTSQVVSGIDWCVQQPGVQIISMSLSTTEGSDGLDSVSQASNAAVDAGKIVVAGAGNSGDGPGSVGSPGAAAQVIAVGAAAEWSATLGAENHSSGVYLAPFSSRGPTLGPAPRIKPDIVGPGVSIMGASAGAPAGYRAASGTSMSTPFVSGAIALALDAAPGLTPAQVESLLQTTAQDWGRPARTTTSGGACSTGSRSSRRRPAGRPRRPCSPTSWRSAAACPTTACGR